MVEERRLRTEHLNGPCWQTGETLASMGATHSRAASMGPSNRDVDGRWTPEDARTSDSIRSILSGDRPT